MRSRTRCEPPNARSSTSALNGSLSIGRQQYTGHVRFGPWYSLADAGDHAPPAENVVQVRLAHGLLDYPRGKSAMVWYAHSHDVRAEALALARTHAGEDLLCRH